MTEQNTTTFTLQQKARFKKAASERPLAWFNFHTYFRIPVGTIIAIIGIIRLAIALNIYGWNNPATPYFIFFVFYLTISVATFFGLHFLLPWGYAMNIVLLVLEVFISAIVADSMVEGIAVAFIYGMGFLLPNIIYFTKRKQLFKPYQLCVVPPNTNTDIETSQPEQTANQEQPGVIPKRIVAEAVHSKEENSEENNATQPNDKLPEAESNTKTNKSLIAITWLFIFLIGSIAYGAYQNHQLSFYQEHCVATVENSKYYHTLDCQTFKDAKNYWLFNIEYAQLKGYTGCPYCH